MKPRAWAAAITTLAGASATFGWWHAVGAAGLLLFLWLTVNVVRNRGWMRARNGHDMTADGALHAADSIITTMAAAIGTETARDLALEASAILDDMAAASAAPDELINAARHLAREFPKQLRDRARTSINAPDVGSVEEPAKVRSNGAESEWIIETRTADQDQVLAWLNDRHLVDAQRLFRHVKSSGDETITVWLTLYRPMTPQEALAHLRLPFAANVYPHSDPSAETRRHAAG